mmetsp:Transcript_9854/g.14575  ORF Transcript_9854/g.14575 Transcript_9854/m.14575 type:complete len:962 (-) Transcript_9854:593-3478(-)
MHDSRLNSPKFIPVYAVYIIMSAAETAAIPEQSTSSSVTSLLLSPAAAPASAGSARISTDQEYSLFDHQPARNEDQPQKEAWTTMASSPASMSTSISFHPRLENLLPGAFVVLQGMAGDGLRNTIESMPILSFQSDPGLGDFAGAEEDQQHPREDSSTISSVTESHSRATLSSSAELPTDNSGVRTNGAESSALSSTTMHRPPRETSSSSGGDDDDTSDGFQHVRDHSVSDDDDGSVLFFHSTNSGSEGESRRGQDRHASRRDGRDEMAITAASCRAVESSVTGAVPSIARGTSTTESGLRLPIPPGLTYGSLLPPVLPTASGPGHTHLTTTNARPLIRGTVEDPLSQQGPLSTVGEDSFVVVPDGTCRSESHAGMVEEATTDTLGQMAEPNLSSRTATDASTQSSASQPCTSGNNRRTRTRQERSAIQRWEAECRERENHQRDEVLLQTANPQSASGVSAPMSFFSYAHRRQLWWQRDGQLAVFAALPHMSVQGITTEVIGDLSPGVTVVGTEIITVDNRSLQPVPQRTQGGLNHGRSLRTYRRGYSQFLKIESPITGYVLYSVDGYAYLGPGLPSSYVKPGAWIWRVTCPDGAYVREGLELTSVHVDTIPHGSFLRVTRKTVNSMGLSRLRVEASLEINDEFDDVHSGEEGESRMRTVVGWISESLNPLSGQRGPIAQPVPFPIPALYRVRLQDGAVIRSGVELSSSQIGHAPLGSILKVIGRSFSEHPMDQCIERLQLAGGGGWVSVRLNLPPPSDDLVVQLVGIDGTFDPDDPGSFHLESQQRVISEYRDPNPLVGPPVDEDASHASPALLPNREFRSLSTGISSINDTDDGTSFDEGGSSSLEPERHVGSNSRVNHNVATAADLSTNGSTAAPTLFRSGIGGGSTGMMMMGSMAKNLPPDERCLICLTEPRTATMVHGETGHIACCLTCARILKARGDRCPVCRLPIDSVIQQFWA